MDIDHDRRERDDERRAVHAALHEVWPSFDADRLEEAIDPEATIHHSGMESPIRGAEEPDYVRAIKALTPDIGLEVANWAAIGRWDNLELLAQIDPAVDVTAFAEAAARLAGDGITRPAG